MKMNDYINDFTNHLTDAMEIGETSIFKTSEKKFHNILICGLGGSGIGGTIINDIVHIDGMISEAVLLERVLESGISSIETSGQRFK